MSDEERAPENGKFDCPTQTLYRNNPGTLSRYFSAFSRGAHLTQQHHMYQDIYEVLCKWRNILDLQKFVIHFLSSALPACSISFQYAGKKEFLIIIIIRVYNHVQHSINNNNNHHYHHRHYYYYEIIWCYDYDVYKTFYAACHTFFWYTRRARYSRCWRWKSANISLIQSSSTVMQLSLSLSFSHARAAQSWNLINIIQMIVNKLISFRNVNSCHSINECSWLMAHDHDEHEYPWIQPHLVFFDVEI